MGRKCAVLIFLFFYIQFNAKAQILPVKSTLIDTFHTQKAIKDSNLRITNLTPFFNLPVDSILNYQLTINKEVKNYYFFLKNQPIGLKINKDNGLLTFKGEKTYFLNGKLKYDQEYKVQVGVQNLADPDEKIDTTFTLVFYNTEVIYPKVKLSVGNLITTEEGTPINFKVQCESGNFEINEILFNSNISIADYKMVNKCGDDFSWMPPFDFVKETDSGKAKILHLSFIGISRFKTRDTANIKIIVKDALNYPFAMEEYRIVASNIKSYLLRLKYSFLQIDKKIKKTKSIRTSFDLTSATTALTGTILSTAGTSESSKTTGKILPSVGIAMVPVKEASAPNKVVEQNQASLIRSSIKRLEFMLFDYGLVGEKDPAINTKITKLKEELKQSQMQLIDVPVDITNSMTEQELNDYFNNPKVNKKYRMKKK